MITDLSINPQKTTQKIVEFIRKTIHKPGFSKVVVGLSGGIDSAVCGTLATTAIGPDNVYVGIFPYEEMNGEGEDDALLLVASLNIPASNIIKIDIKPLVDKIIA